MYRLSRGHPNLFQTACKFSPIRDLFSLVPGDEFEVTQRMGMGYESAGMHMESVTKQVFTVFHTHFLEGAAKHRKTAPIMSGRLLDSSDKIST